MKEVKCENCGQPATFVVAGGDDGGHAFCSHRCQTEQRHKERLAVAKEAFAKKMERDE